jgi:nitroreductase
MFAMSLVYGLHAQGLGSCCLNWCAELSAERRLRAITEIPDHEAVIMMIAIGHVPESLLVAQSVRKPLSEVLVHGHVAGKNDAE